MEINTLHWKIGATDAAEPFVAMLSDEMRDNGIPWLQRVSDTKGFARYCADESS